MKKFIIFSFAISLAGCALPTTTVKTGAQRPMLAVQGAPTGVVLYIDGLSAGAANQYDGLSQKLFIEEGVHHLELRQDTQVLMSQKIYSSNGETNILEYKAAATK
jgi:hypothetical protein